jgi:hypothetical protein
MEQRDQLEEFIFNHNGEFDLKEPSDLIWKKINKKAGKTQKYSTIYKTAFRIAAIFILLFSITVLTYYSNNKKAEQPEIYGFAANTPEIIELRDAEIYYSSQINEKIAQLEKCSKSNPELVKEVENDLSQLDHSYNLLKNDLKENIANQQVIEAMIENNRERLVLLEDVLTQINC